MRSILDTDTYKLTMQQAALKLYPRAVAKYKFVNRNPAQKFTRQMVNAIDDEIYRASRLYLTEAEEAFLREACPYLYPWYIDWLKQFHLDPSQVNIDLRDDQLVLSVMGPWCETICWEVPLLSIITQEIMKQQKVLNDEDFALLAVEAKRKGQILAENRCRFADFGTRRRYSDDVHVSVLENLAAGAGDYFIGTSNVHFARQFGIKPIGTMAHEFIQAISGLVGLRYANRYAMEAWNSVYQGRLGIVLTDTFGTDAFFRDFDGVFARLFDGVRQDSGDPINFMKRVVAHYKKLGIDPRTKTIVFSDSLTVDLVSFINRACRDYVNCSFGIGTHLTSDIPGTTPANIVIKMIEIDGIPVVKLSDDPKKAVGDQKAIDVAKWTFRIKD